MITVPKMKSKKKTAKQTKNIIVSFQADIYFE